MLPSTSLHVFATALSLIAILTPTFATPIELRQDGTHIFENADFPLCLYENADCSGNGGRWSCDDQVQYAVKVTPNVTDFKAIRASPQQRGLKDGEQLEFRAGEDTVVQTFNTGNLRPGRNAKGVCWTLQAPVDGFRLWTESA